MWRGWWGLGGGKLWEKTIKHTKKKASKRWNKFKETAKRKTRGLLRPSVRLYVPTRHIHPIGVTFEIEPWHAAPSRTIEPHFNIMQSECNEAIHGESQPTARGA